MAIPPAGEAAHVIDGLLYHEADLSSSVRRVKRLVRPGLGFASFRTARRTLAGYEVMTMMRKGQVRRIGGCDIQAQASFVVGLFQIAA